MKQTVFMIVSRANREDPRVLKEALSLTRAGFQVQIWAWLRKRKGDQTLTWGGYYVNKISTPSVTGSTLGLALSFPMFWVAAIIRALIARPWAVHCHDFDTVPIGLAMQTIARAKFVYDAHEIYSEMVSTDVPSSVTRLIRSLEFLTLKVADLVITTNSEQFRVYRRYERIVVAPNTPSFASARQPSENPAKEVFYGGSLTPDKGIVEMIDALSMNEGVGLVIAGYGPLELFIRERCRSSHLLKFLGIIPRKELFERLWQSVATVVFYQPVSLNNIYNSSNKMFEAMMLGVPVITNAESACARIVEKEDCGLIVPYGDVVALATAVKRLVQDPGYRLLLGRNGHRAFSARYAWERYEPDLIRSYRNLTI